MSDELYYQYYDKLYYWALKKTNNKEDASDLVQNIFCAIYTYFNKGIEIIETENLIWKIAHNLWCKKAKEYYKEKNVIYNEEVINNKETNGLDVIDQMIYLQIKDDIVNNKYKLTEKERECFCLYYYKQYSIEEIAKKINSNNSNVKYYLYNSRKKIKERI